MKTENQVRVALSVAKSRLALARRFLGEELDKPKRLQQPEVLRHERDAIAFQESQVEAFTWILEEP